MERRTSADPVILWGNPYGVPDRDKSSNGVNDLFQEGKPYLESKGFVIFSVGPKVDNDVADYNFGRAVNMPKWFTKVIGTSLPISLPFTFDKRKARDIILKVLPHILFLDEPTASLGFLAHGLISGMPRREDGKPVSVIVSRHHAGVYAERTEKIYRFLLELGKLIRRPEFTTYGAPNGKITRGMRNTIFESIVARTAVSCSTARAFEKRLNDGTEYRIIYNGINTEELTPDGPIIEEWTEEDGKDIILCAPGRLEPRKGVPYFIKAAPIIKEEKPNTVFILVGGNKSDRKPYETMVDSMGIRQYFRFAERLPRNRYPDALRTAKLCMCTQIGGEGFGRVVVEPLACGTPVVASNIDAYNEVTEGGQSFALMSEPKDPDDIAKKAIEILNWSAEMREKMRWEAAMYVRERFGWPIIANQLENFVNDSCNKHGGVDWLKWKETYSAKHKLPTSGTIFRKK